MFLAPLFHVTPFLVSLAVHPLSSLLLPSTLSSLYNRPLHCVTAAILFVSSPFAALPFLCLCLLQSVMNCAKVLEMMKFSNGKAAALILEFEHMNVQRVVYAQSKYSNMFMNFTFPVIAVSQDQFEFPREVTPSSFQFSRASSAQRD